MCLPLNQPPTSPHLEGVAVPPREAPGHELPLQASRARRHKEPQVACSATRALFSTSALQKTAAP